MLGVVLAIEWFLASTLSSVRIDYKNPDPNAQTCAEVAKKQRYDALRSTCCFDDVAR
jgi:hypothetical protein